MLKKITSLILTSLLILIIFTKISNATTYTEININKNINKNNIYLNSSFLALQKHLSKTKQVKGKFTQKRFIAVLSNPLISSGKFTLSKTKGLTWIQEKPFASTLTLNTSVLTQTIQGNPPMILTKEKQPVVFSFSKMFLSIFKGDSTTLRQSFNISFHGDLKNWSMILIPKSFPINKAIKSISLSGGDVINQVIINNVKKDKLIIKFYDVKVKT